jgi:hypothetical protein
MWTFAGLWRNGPIGARLCVAYFAAMETLQAFQYSYIGLCDNGVNQFLTILGFLHLAFQPFFANLYLSAYMTKAQKRYVPLILSLSLFAGVLMSNRMWKSKGDFDCSYGIEPMCGKQTCTFRGDVHLAWQMPLQHSDQDYFTPGFNLHFFMFYLPTFALGMWPLTLFLLFSGPFLGRVMTKHQDEIPAIWCYFSIAQLFFPLAWAYLSKTAMFAPNADGSAKVVAANGHANGRTNGHTNGHANGTNGHAIAAKDEEEDPIGNGWAIAKRTIYFGLALTAKRYITVWNASQTSAAAK